MVISDVTAGDRRRHLRAPDLCGQRDPDGEVVGREEGDDDPHRDLRRGGARAVPPRSRRSRPRPDGGLSAWVEDKVAASDRPELTCAGIVVSGGRGVGSEENFALIEKLADKLNAAVGRQPRGGRLGLCAERLAGGPDRQGRGAGRSTSPSASRARSSTWPGMKDSKVIVAINKDEEAPIFQVADYGLVGDLFTARAGADRKALIATQAIDGTGALRGARLHSQERCSTRGTSALATSAMHGGAGQLGPRPVASSGPKTMPDTALRAGRGAGDDLDIRRRAGPQRVDHPASDEERVAQPGQRLWPLARRRSVGQPEQDHRCRTIRDSNSRSSGRARRPAAPPRTASKRSALDRVQRPEQVAGEVELGEIHLRIQRAARRARRAGSGRCGADARCRSGSSGSARPSPARPSRRAAPATSKTAGSFRKTSGPAFTQPRLTTGRPTSGLQQRGIGIGDELAIGLGPAEHGDIGPVQLALRPAKQQLRRAVAARKIVERPCARIRMSHHHPPKVWSHPRLSCRGQCCQMAKPRNSPTNFAADLPALRPAARGA